MAPVFDPTVFDPGVFDTGNAGWSATMQAGGATLTGALASSVILLAGIMAAGGATMSGPLLTKILLIGLMATAGATLTGDLKVARFMGRLSTCGEPLTTANQDWLLKE